jgi:hypothetical protein
MVKRFWVLWAALLVIPLVGFAMPQAGQGEIKGRVTDPQGKVIPDTTVVFIGVTNGKEQRGTTDQAGEFVITGVEPGKYTLQSSTGQTITTGSQVSVDSTGASTIVIVQESSGQLEVRAETHVEDRSTANIKTAWDDLQIELLPQPNAIDKGGKFYGAYNLSLLNEGVTTGYIFQNGVGPSVGGRPNTSNNYHVNATDNNNQLVPGPLVTVTNEATTDFTLMQGQQLPQFGHSTGGQMNSVLADGSNKWHGGVYDYFNNRKLNAVEPVLRGQRIMRYDQNRLGGKVGGPVWKNSVFAFADFEYIPLRAEQPFLNPAFAPTAEGFATLAATPGVSAANLAALQNNVQVSQTTIASATVLGRSVPLGLVNSGARIHQNQYNGVANIDWNMDQKSALGVRYVHNDLGTNAFGSNLPGFAVPGHSRSLLGALNYTATPTNLFAFNVNVGYNRLDQNVGGGSFAFPGRTVFPNITIQELGLPLGSQVAIGRARTNMYQLSGWADWRMGGNDIRFGMDVRKLQSVFGNFGSANGNFTFGSLQRFLLDLPPDTGGIQSFGGTSFVGDRWLLHPFIQDSFRFHSVDLEVGLAWEYSTIPESWKRQAALANFSVPGLINFKEPEADHMNFEPRIGFAWSPSAASHTVVRGGAGIVYDALNETGLTLSPDMMLTTLSSARPVTPPGFFASGPLTAPTTTPAGVGAVAPIHQELPYIIHWNAALSHGFWGRLATEIKYMGHHGVNLPLQTFLTSPFVTASSSLPVFFTNPGQPTLDALTTTQTGLATTVTPFTTAGFTNSILTTQPAGNSWYNAAAFKVSETFTAGTQVMAQYTYQDLRSNATNTPLDLAFGNRWEQVPWNQKHRATVTPIIDVASMLPRSSGVVRDIIANLSLMGTLTYARGGRIPMFSAIDTGMNASGLGSGVFVNPNGIGGMGSGVTPLTNSSGQVVAFMATNPNAQFVAGAPGTFSAARPTMRLGDTRNIDLSVVKRFSVPEKAKIEVRADALNLFNHPQFTGMPISTLGTGTHVTPSFLVPDSSLFNNMRGTLSGNPRTLQLALRLMF